MADYPNTDPRHDARYRATETQSGASLLFIVGGLVVAVGFIIWLVAGASSVAPTVVPASDGNDVIIDNTAPPATDGTTGTTPAVPPADADTVTPDEATPVTPDTTAPADTDAAPADPDAPATP